MIIRFTSLHRITIKKNLNKDEDQNHLIFTFMIFHTKNIVFIIRLKTDSHNYKILNTISIYSIATPL